MISVLKNTGNIGYNFADTNTDTVKMADIANTDISLVKSADCFAMNFLFILSSVQVLYFENFLTLFGIMFPERRTIFIILYSSFYFFKDQRTTSRHFFQRLFFQVKRTTSKNSTSEELLQNTCYTYRAA